MLKRFLIMIAMVGATTIGQETRTKTKLVFNCSCEDAIGELYATAFRDLLATSPRYTETDKAFDLSSNGVASYAYKVSVISIDDSSNEEGGISAAFSVVLLAGNYRFIDHTLQIMRAQQGILLRR